MKPLILFSVLPWLLALGIGCGEFRDDPKPQAAAELIAASPDGNYHYMFMWRLAVRSRVLQRLVHRRGGGMSGARRKIALLSAVAITRTLKQFFYAFLW